MRIAAHVSALALLALLANGAAGRDIYVSNVAGDDGFSGLQPRVMSDQNGPVRTIAKALRVAMPGDRIVLEKTDQPYREGISLVGSRHSGYAHQAFTLAGNGAILDGSAPVPTDAWEHYRGDVFRYRPPRAGSQQLFIDDRPALRVPTGLMADQPPKLDPLQWCLLDGYIYFCVEKDKLPADYRLTCAHFQTGITLYHVARVAIIDLTVQGFRLDGISAFNSARDVFLGGVTCRGNGRNGITVGGASTAEIDVSLVGNNGQAQLLTLPYSETRIRNSRLLGNTAPGWVDEGGRVTIGDERVSGGREEVLPEADKQEEEAKEEEQ